MLNFHIKEIKFRFFYSILSYLLNVLIIWSFHGELIEYLIQLHLIFTSITEGFYISIQFSLILGFIYSFPFLYWQVYEFILPGLYKYESEKLLDFKWIFLIFIIFSFSFKNILLLFLDFFIQFESQYLSLLLTFQHFISFINQILGLILILTILPLIIYYFKHFFIKNRRFNYFLVLIFLGFITPPDVISLLITFLLIFLLVEIILFISIIE